jgi:RNA polymerase sigma factor (TIGR02999 family)
MSDLTECVNGREPRAWPGVYVEMRRLGSTIIAGERVDPADGGLTAIVHEAWAKLQQNPPRDGWQSRAHFFGSASHAMRQCLIDQARRRNAAKRRAPGAGCVDPEEIVDSSPGSADQCQRVLEVDSALRELATIDANWAAVAEMKLFGDLPNDMIAERLGTSRRSVERYWVQASEWLRKRLG